MNGLKMESTFRLSFQKDPLTLDPQKCGDPISTTAIFLLFKGLTRLEADHTIRCDLANFFHISHNYKKYVFQLGEHVWSDGTSITAHDFVYSWKRALSPEFPARSINFFHYIKNTREIKNGRLSLDKAGFYAEDNSTLVVELERPCPYFLELTSFCPFFPVSSKTDEKEVFSICSGAFQMQQWKKGESIDLKRNPRCKERARIERIHIRIIPDEKKAFKLFESNDLDWIGDPISPLPVNYLPALFSNKKIKPIAGSVGCWFNTLKRPFSNPDLRRALGLAIPRALKKPFSNSYLRKAFSYEISRERLLQKLQLPDALLAEHFYQIFLQEDDIVFIKEYINKASYFLKNALKNLKLKQLKITLSFENTEAFSHLASVLKDLWKEEFNVSVNLEPLSFKEFFQKLQNKQYQVALIRILAQYSDAMNFLERFESADLPRNFSGWENLKYKTLLKKYEKTTDPKKSQALIFQAEKILLEEMPIAPIHHTYFTYLQKSYVHNFVISPSGIAQFDRISLKKESCIERKSF